MAVDGRLMTVLYDTYPEALIVHRFFPKHHRYAIAENSARLFSIWENRLCNNNQAHLATKT